MPIFSSTHSQNKIILLILIVFSLVLFRNSLTNLFALDDNIVITENTLIKDLNNIPKMFKTKYWPHKDNANYRPLLILSFALNYAIHKESPFGYHLVNILLHALNVCLIFLLLFRLFNNSLLSILTALLFAAHPIHTEAVANVVGRAELLVTFFMLLTLIYHDKQKYFLAFVFLVIACLCKEFAIVTPFLAFAISLKRKHDLKKEWSAYLLYFSIIALLVIIRYQVCGRLSSVPIWYHNPVALAPPLTRILTAMTVFFDSLVQLIYPATLSPDYSFNHIPALDHLNFKATCAILLMFGLIIAAFVSLFKKRTYMLAISLFLIPYMLTSNILFPIETLRAERWLYAPSIGSCLILGLLLHGLLDKKNHKIIQALSLIVLTITLGAYSYKTIKQNRVWHDTDSLYLMSFDASTNNYMMLGSTGSVLALQNKCHYAIPFLEESFKHIKTYETHVTTLAFCYEEYHQFNKAIQVIKEYLSLKPNNVLMMNNLGVIYNSANQPEKAIPLFLKAIEDNPHNSLYYKANLKRSLEIIKRRNQKNTKTDVLKE